MRYGPEMRRTVLATLAWSAVLATAAVGNAGAQVPSSGCVSLHGDPAQYRPRPALATAVLRLALPNAQGVQRTAKDVRRRLRHQGFDIPEPVAGGGAPAGKQTVLSLTLTSVRLGSGFEFSEQQGCPNENGQLVFHEVAHSTITLPATIYQPTITAGLTQAGCSRSAPTGPLVLPPDYTYLVRGLLAEHMPLRRIAGILTHDGMPTELADTTAQVGARVLSLVLSRSHIGARATIGRQDVVCRPGSGATYVSRTRTLHPARFQQPTARPLR